MGCGIGRFGKYEAKNPTMDLYHPQTICNPGLEDVKWNDTFDSLGETIGLLPNMQGFKSFPKVDLLVSNSETT